MTEDSGRFAYISSYISTIDAGAEDVSFSFLRNSWVRLLSMRRVCWNVAQHISPFGCLKPCRIEPTKIQIKKEKDIEIDDARLLQSILGRNWLLTLQRDKFRRNESTRIQRVGKRWGGHNRIGKSFLFSPFHMETTTVSHERLHHAG